MLQVPYNIYNSHRGG